jgi:hypothetical protein
MRDAEQNCAETDNGIRGKSWELHRSKRVSRGTARARLRHHE